MSESLPEKPADSRATLERQDGAVVITLPRDLREVAVGVGAGGCLLLCIGAMQALTIYEYHTDPIGTSPEGKGWLAFQVGLVAFFGVVLLGVLMWGLFRLLARYGQTAEVRVTADALDVEVRGLTPSSHRWRRDELAAVGAWGGLRVVTTAGHKVALLPGRPWDEVRWLAQVLGAVLGVPDRLPPGAGELAVTFAGSFWPSAVPGLLRVEKGRMTLRHPLAPQPFLTFRAAAEGDVKDVKSVPLTPQDVTGRVEEDGGRLEIARPLSLEAGQALRKKDAVNVPLAAFFNQHKGGENENFHLSIWCADKDAVQEALARFWGAHAEG